VKAAAVRKLLADVLEFDHQDASSDVQQYGHHLMRSLGCVVDARETPIQKVTLRLPSMGLCGDLAPSNFHSVGPLEKPLGGYRRQILW